METPSFQPGRAPRETKEQKKERLRNQRLRLRKEKERKARKGLPFKYIESKPSWLILPYHLTKGFEFWLVTLPGETFLQKRKSLLDEIERMKKPSPKVDGFDTTSNENFRKEYLVKAQTVMSFLYQNQKLRWIFKNFFTKLRIERFESANDVDPITLEQIGEAIRFPSFTQRKLYVFEAKPFARNLHNKLINNDGHIPDPLPPKNPLTNEQFTLAQTISLIAQTRKYGHSSWAIEAFIASRYDVASFAIINSKPLRLHALRTTMAKVDDWDSIDTLYDFIKTQHAIHNAVFSMSIYKWAVNHATKEQRIQDWRKLCLKWYEVDILMDDASSKLDLFRVIEAKTLRLCSKPDELTSLRVRKAKSPATSDGSRSSRHTENTG